MIPARLGSKRLPKKNLLEIKGKPLIEYAAVKCLQANVFDQVYINSDSTKFQEIANRCDVDFHKRPEILGSDSSTSEQYVAEFLQKHKCEWLVQVHSIAPLLSVAEIIKFVNNLKNSDLDTILSYQSIQIECSQENQPINFTFEKKENSQELKPIQRITWSITAWRRETYLRSIENNLCATYSGRIGMQEISQLGSQIIKNREDLEIVKSLWHLVNK